MAELLLAHNFHMPLDPQERAAGKPYPPLGTLVSAAAVAAPVYDPTFSADPDTFSLALEGHRPRRVAILADPHAIPQKMCTIGMRQAAFAMIRQAKRHGCEVLVAGPDASDRPAVYAEAGADVVVVGEHDDVFVEWVEGRIGAGIVPRRPVKSDLSQVPPPAWERVDMARYARMWRERHGMWEVNVSTARGCPYRCNWCAKPTWGRTYHVRPVAQVVAELEALRSRYSPDRIWFTDDIFAIRPAWLAEFRAAMSAPMPFRCLTRVDLVKDEAYVRDLAAAGCVEVWLGAESGSDSVLTAMDKDATVAEIERASDMLRAHGIRRGFFLQLGYPGETAEDVDKTVAMVRALGPEEIGVSVSYPLPGTVFHDRMHGRLRGESWQGAMDNTLLFESDYPQSFYDTARELLRSEHAVLRFQLQPSGPRRAAGALFHALRRPLLRRRLAGITASPG